MAVYLLQSEGTHVSYVQSRAGHLPQAGGFNNRHFLTVLEAGSPKSGCRQGGFF
jgi:hypothetical protein